MVYSTDGYRIYSPGIRIQSKSATLPTATSKSASSGTDGLSTGAKAGIGVGIGMGGLALLTTLGFFLLRRRHRPSSRELTGVRESSDLGSAQTPADGFYQKPKPPPQELSIGSLSPAELASTLGRWREGILLTLGFGNTYYSFSQPRRVDYECVFRWKDICRHIS